MKHCFTLKINQFIFLKHFDKMSLSPDNIYTFYYMFQNYYQNSGRAVLASACRWRTQGVEMMCARLFTRVANKTWLHWV